MAKVQDLPKWDGDIEAEYVKLLPGGCALNQARQLDGMGGDVRFVGSIGDDSFGDMLKQHCEKQGFSTKWIKTFKGLPSSLCVCLTGPQDRGFVSCYSTTKAFTSVHIEERERALEGCAHFHMGGYFNMLGIHNERFTEIVKRFKAKGGTFSLHTQYDATEAWTGDKGHLKELLPLIDILIVNEVEFNKICTNVAGDPDPKALLSKFPAVTIVETKGKDGATVFRAGKPAIEVPTRSLDKIVDATGAGDAFIAGFLERYFSREHRGTGCSEEERLRDACLRGHAVARVCINREGACVEPVRPEDLEV